MCRALALTYRCTHSHAFLLSRCLGTFVSRHKPLCLGTPPLTRQLASLCGNCARRACEAALLETVLAAREKHPRNADGFEGEALRRAEGAYGQGMWRVQEEFPWRTERGKGKGIDWGAGARGKRRRKASLLRYEVRVEDLVEVGAERQIGVGEVSSGELGDGHWDSKSQGEEREGECGVEAGEGGESDGHLEIQAVVWYAINDESAAATSTGVSWCLEGEITTVADWESQP